LHPMIGRDLRGAVPIQEEAAVGNASRTVIAVRPSLVEEMALGELGDQRLNGRRNRVLAALEQHPDTSFPEVCGDDAEVEALYRFLRNRRLSLATLIEPHFAATHARCVAVGEVLVIHDTTDLVFVGETARAGLSPLGAGRQGFWLQTALAVSADGLRAPLGLVSLQPYVRKTGTRSEKRARVRNPENKSRYWRGSRRCGRGSGRRPR
jgi:Transposase DNA-binding